MLVAAAAALLAMAATPQPTGTEFIDPVMTAAATFGVAVAGSRARRWSWIWISTLAAAVTSVQPLLLFALPALVLALIVVQFERRSRIIGSLIVGLALQALLRLPDMGPDGTTALLTVVAVAPVLISAFWRLHRLGRRRIWWGVGAAVVVTAVATVAFGLAALEARDLADEGIDLARDGLAAVRDGDTDRARSLLEASADRFEEAESTLSGPLTWPSLAVPYLGHQANTTRILAESGADVARQAARSVDLADVGNLRLRDGRVDVAQITVMAAPADESFLALLDAAEELDALGSVWLLPPVSSAVNRLSDEIDQAIPQAELVSLGIEQAPWLLGSPGERRYFVAFGQTAESRFGGGFIGTYAEIVASNGHLAMERSGPIEELRGDPEVQERIITDLAYLDRYARYQPEYNLQNITAAPDLPTSYRVLDELYPQIASRGIDGMIYLDPTGVAALLQLTGPVSVIGLDEPLTAANVERFLTQTIYRDFPITATRDPILQASIEAVFEALTTGDLAGPSELARVIGPVARGGHLMLTTANSGANDFLHEAGADGAVSGADDFRDYLAVHTANSAPNKLDPWLRRDITYDVTWLPGGGGVEATLTVELTNEAPEGLPQEVEGNWELNEGYPGASPPGTAFQYVSVYSPFELLDARLDGEPAAVEFQFEGQRSVYSAQIGIPRGERVTLVLTLRGQIGPEEYLLDVDQQATAGPGSTTVRVHSADGSSPSLIEGLDERLGDGAQGTVDPTVRHHPVSVRYD